MKKALSIIQKTLRPGELISALRAQLPTARPLFLTITLILLFIFCGCSGDLKQKYPVDRNSQEWRDTVDRLFRAWWHQRELDNFENWYEQEYGRNLKEF